MTTFDNSLAIRTTTQSLIAIKPAMPAGAAVSGFASLSLTSPVEARVGPNDYISLITVPDRSASTTTAQTARVVHFNGSSFDVVSSGTLP